jgi:hypothetical protein
MADPKPTRHFFRKAIAPPPKPPKDQKQRRYSKRQLVVAENIHPLTGKRVVRFLSASAAARKVAASIAGKASQASGRANRFTSESGSKASKKLWTTRQRKVNGIRIGNKLTGWKKGQRLDRMALRKLYHEHPKHGIKCVYQSAVAPAWERTDPTTGVTSPITERTALIRLGYMKQYLRFVPTSIRMVPLRGTKAAMGTGEPVNPISGE